MVRIKSILNKIPKLPLSALVFYLFVLLLWRLGIIPSPAGIVIFLEGLYQNYGNIGLFIAAFLEGIVYLGLYFPGSFIIAASIFLSDGSLTSLLIITLVVSVAWTITSVIDYLLGIFVSLEKKPLKDRKKLSKGFLLSFAHQNLLAFYFFNEGINRENPWKLLMVFPIMFVWGFFVVSIFSLFRTYLRQAAESPVALLVLILGWFVIAFILELRRKDKNGTKN